MADIKLFEYKSKRVRTAVAEGQIWFVAKDVAEALDISWSGVTLAPIKQEWQRMMKFITTSGEKELRVISEGAVYKLAFRSNKPEAERFTDWVASEVIPQIRRTGRYVPQHQGVLPLEAHTDTRVQKDMSKSVNSHNYQLGGIQQTIEYNVANCQAHTGQTPKTVKHYGKHIKNLPAKQCTSAKEVLRVIDPETACCMSLADNLVEQGHEAEKVFKVTASREAKSVFKGMLALGATPAELNQ